MKEIDELKKPELSRDDVLYYYPDELNELEDGDNIEEDYEFERRIGKDNQVSVDMYENLVGQFAVLNEEFSKYKKSEDLIHLYSASGSYRDKNNKEKRTVVFAPRMNARSEQVVLMDADSKSVKSMVDAHKDLLKIIDDMEEAYPKEQFPVHNRILEFEKRHALFLNDPEAADLLAGCPEYNLSFQKTMAYLPKCMFKNPKGVPKYIQNMDKWTEFHQNHVFIDQAEENQEFFLNSYIPYAKKMKAGTLTAEDSIKYNEAYAEHMLKQKQYFDEIKAYDLESPEFKDNYVQDNRDEFNRQWRGPGFADRMLYDIETSFDLMDKGWPAADMVLLRELKMARARIIVIADNDEKIYSPEEVRMAKEIRKSMEPAYSNIMGKELLSPEDRRERLKAIEEPIKKYAALYQNYNKRTIGNDYTEVGDTSISWLLSDAIGRKVFRIEVGKDKQNMADAKTTIGDCLKNVIAEYADSVPKAEKEQKLNQKLINDFRNYGTAEVFEEALSMAGEDTRIVIGPQASTEHKLQTVIDEKKFKVLRDEVKELASETEKMYKDFGDDEIGLEMKEFVKAKTTNVVNHVLSGYNDIYLQAKTPFVVGLNVILPQIPASNVDNYLRDRFTKWEDRFPIHRLYVQCRKQLNTFADYYEEKELSDGVLSPEREEYYRQLIYDQTIVASALYNKVMATIENPKLYTELVKDKVLQDEPSCIHPLTARGTATLKTSLEGYKIALENGWTLEDAALIATFGQAIYAEEKRAGYSVSTTLEGLEKYAEPKYESPEKQQFVERMKAVYEDIKEHPLKSPADRDKYIKQMDALIKEGETKKYLSSKQKSKGKEFYTNQSYVNYYKHLKFNNYEHNIKIGKGEALAFHAKPLEKGTEREITAVLSDFTAARTDMWFSSESKKHENLRKACENLQKFIKVNPDKGQKLQEAQAVMDYAAEYLSQLDNVRYNADIYVDARNSASSEGGKTRLNGAITISSFVDTERDSVLREVNKKTGKDFKNVEELRLFMASDKKSKAFEELSRMEEMPTDEAGKKKLASLVADVLVYKFATAAGNGEKAFHNMGVDLMKKEILKNSDFKSLMKSFHNDRNMTPGDLANEINNGNILTRINSTKKKVKNMNDKAVAKENKKKEAIDKYKSKADGPKPKA